MIFEMKRWLLSAYSIRSIASEAFELVVSMFGPAGVVPKVSEKSLPRLGLVHWEWYELMLRMGYEEGGRSTDWGRTDPKVYGRRSPDRGFGNFS